jgi:hypothetical protein
MVKLCIALGIALVVALFTAVFGLMQGVRPVTVLYRAVVSLAGFALAGYLAGIAAESYVRRRVDAVKPRGNKVDIISKDGVLEKDELLNPSHAAQQFTPLVPENLEKITVK